MTKTVEELLRAKEGERGGIVERAIVMVAAMNAGEFDRFMAALVEMEGAANKLADGIKNIVDNALVEDRKTGGAAYRKKSSPYWCKTFGGWDEGAKKGFRLEGKFVRTSEYASKQGEYVAVGMNTVSGKRYAIAVLDAACGGYDFERQGDGHTVTVEGVHVIDTFDNWDAFESAAKGRGL